MIIKLEGRRFVDILQAKDMRGRGGGRHHHHPGPLGPGPGFFGPGPAIGIWGGGNKCNVF